MLYNVWGVGGLLPGAFRVARHTPAGENIAVNAKAGYVTHTAPADFFF